MLHWTPQTPFNQPSSLRPAPKYLNPSKLEFDIVGVRAYSRARMAPFSFLANPFALILTQRLTLVLLVGFTSSDSFLRLMLFPLLVVWQLYMLPYYSESAQCKIWVLFWAGEAIFASLHYIEKIFLRKWSYDTASISMKSASISASVGSSKIQGSLQTREKTQASTKTLDSDGEGSLWRRFRFGLYVAFSDRYIGSPYQVAHTPPYSTSNPSYIPSRISFVLRKICIIITCYLLVDIFSQLSNPSLNSKIYSDTQIPFASRLWHSQMTVLEIATRTASSIGFWLGNCLALQAIYSAMSLLAVCTGLSRPELERPIFGSAREAYTLRGFWGRAWHQTIRGRLTSVADWVTYDLLELPRSSGRKGEAGKRWAKALIPRLGSRYTHVMVCFLVSGVAHQFLDVAMGLRWGESGAVVFFVLMAVGIMAEDALQWAWYDALLSLGDRENTPERFGERGSLWARIIGYFWVVFWFSVSTPWWAYPVMSRNVGGVKNEVLPFSVVRWIK
ncbi:hypothetical protein G7Y79_00071g097430 [Physcia stellaris]|nr:hypothetical protein G7Y79_00071g097430 [Physcia stellaris]